MTDINAPSGFEPLATSSPFNQNVGPYYCKLVEQGLVLGLRVGTKHCNSKGNLHGAMMSAMADIAIGHNIGLALGRQSSNDLPENVLGVPKAPISTVSLSTDFIGTAQRGAWVECHVDVQRAGRTLAFANAYITTNKTRIARSSAVFRIFAAKD